MADDENERDPLEVLRQVIEQSGMRLISPQELEALAAQPSQSPASATDAEIAENVASIEALPLDELPHGSGRDALLRQAQEGLDAYAYQSIAGCWYVWANGRRYTPEEWLERFP